MKVTGSSAPSELSLPGRGMPAEGIRMGGCWICENGHEPEHAGGRMCRRCEKIGMDVWLDGGGEA